MKFLFVINWFRILFRVFVSQRPTSVPPLKLQRHAVSANQTRSISRRVAELAGVCYETRQQNFMGQNKPSLCLYILRLRISASLRLCVFARTKLAQFHAELQSTREFVMNLVSKILSDKNRHLLVFISLHLCIFVSLHLCAKQFLTQTQDL